MNVPERALIEALEPHLLAGKQVIVPREELPRDDPHPGLAVVVGDRDALRGLIDDGYVSLRDHGYAFRGPSQDGAPAQMQSAPVVRRLTAKWYDRRAQGLQWFLGALIALLAVLATIGTLGVTGYLSR